MANNKRRNHFVPRFLLNKFASRAIPKEDKYWTWQFSKNSQPIEVSTKNAGVASHFYRKENSISIEERFGLIERQFSLAVRSASVGGTLSVHKETFRKFIWIQAVRTRALRAQFAASIHLLLEELEGALSDPFVAEAIRHKLKANFHDIVSMLIKDDPFIRRVIFQGLLYLPPIKRKAFKLLDTAIDSGSLGGWTRMLAHNIGERGLVEMSSARGQLEGLDRLLTSEIVPKGFNPAAWHIIQGEMGEAILGDCCVVALGPDGKSGTLVRFGEDWNEVYLPVCSDKILVGTKTFMRPSLRIDAVNILSSSLSFEHFFASDRSRVDPGLVSIIGKGEALIAAREVVDIVLESILEFGD